MTGFVQKLLEMTLYGSIAIVLVLIFRLLFHKVSKKIICLFWIVVAVRLICPVNFNMGISAGDLLPGIPGVSSSVTAKAEEEDGGQIVLNNNEDAVAALLTGLSGGAVEHTSTGSKAALEGQSETAGPAFFSSALPFLIWACGAILILIVLLIQNRRTWRIIRDGFNRGRIIRDQASGAHIPPMHLILISEKVSTPFVLGILSPVIVLPAIVDSSEKEYLLCHEKVHIKNKDNLTRALGLLIVCLHWFNPLVWVAYKCFCNDLEMRVDEEVIDRIGDSIKKDYCLSIVNHAMSGAQYKVSCASFAKKTLSGMEVKMRIKNLISYKKNSKLVAILVSVIVLGGTMVLSSFAKAKAEEDTETETNVVTFQETSASEEETKISEAETSSEDQDLVLNIDNVEVLEEAGLLDKQHTYRKDFDNDGEDEMILNFQYSASGAERVFILRNLSGEVEVGTHNTSLRKTQYREAYDPEKGEIILYKWEDESETILTMDDFTFQPLIAEEFPW